MTTFKSRDEAERFRRVRESRGRELTSAVREMGDHLYVVPSQSGKKAYTVDWSGPSCDCPDFIINNDDDGELLPCKHIYAVRFFKEVRAQEEMVSKTILEAREGAIGILERHLSDAPLDIRNALGILISS